MARKGVAIDLDALRKEIQEAKENEKPNRAPSLREAIGILLPDIEGLRKAKWSDTQIAEWLGKRGLDISPGTLAQYVREARRNAAAASGDTKAKRQAKMAPSVTTAPAEAKPPVEAKPSSELTPKVEPKVSEKVPETASVTQARVIPNAAAAATTKRRVHDDA